MASTINTNRQVYKKYIARISILYSNRQDIRAFTEILLTMLTVIIFGVFAIRPTITTIVSLFSKINEKQSTLAIMDQKISNLALAQSNFTQERARLALLDFAVPNDPMVTQFIRQLEGLAQKNSVFIVNIDTEEISLTQSDQNEMILTVDVAGESPNLFQYLADIENLRRPMAQTTTTIRTAQNESNQGSLVLSITGRMPFNEK